MEKRCGLGKGIHPTHPHPIEQAQWGPRFAEDAMDGAPELLCLAWNGERRRRFERCLVLAVAAFDTVEEFGGVVAYAVFEDDLYFFYVVDVGGGVAVDDDEVGVLARGD